MGIATGEKIGPYEVISPLGAGGMGEVYRARDGRLGRQVAIKVVSRTLAKDPDRLRRFALEARTVAALNHPNILGIHDIGTHDGSPYLVSELLEGQSLRERLDADPLPARRAIKPSRQDGSPHRLPRIRRIRPYVPSGWRHPEGQTHLGLEKETPGSRIRCRFSGRVFSPSRLGVLHHRYVRAAYVLRG